MCLADKFAQKWKAYKAVEEANVTKGIACSSEDTLAQLVGSIPQEGLSVGGGDSEATNTSVQWAAGRMRVHRFRQEFQMSYGK